jgi:hypothetical protein
MQPNFALPISMGAMSMSMASLNWIAAGVS